MRLLIIGFGNPLRGDDGAGPAVAELLHNRLPDAEIIIAHQTTPELCEPVSRADLVIFIDAAAGGPPGEIRRSAVSPELTAPAFTHHATPAALLQMAATLYGRAARGILYSIAGARFELGDGLSPEVAASVEAAAEAIIRDAERITDAQI